MNRPAGSVNKKKLHLSTSLQQVSSLVPGGGDECGGGEGSSVVTFVVPLDLLDLSEMWD